MSQVERKVSIVAVRRKRVKRCIKASVRIFQKIWYGQYTYPTSQFGSQFSYNL